MALWRAKDKPPVELVVANLEVQDIADRCQVNRNTFYYHFQDIPSLTEWSVEMYP